ncbi:MAG: hypothetical protein ISR69_14810 [Gammaproteobacteria bacterium]|nr:hypothetical protein [Gammaproteobacteria bacterium]
MGYIWTNFGQLSDSDDDGRYLYITNDSGDRRQMSLVKYAPSIPKIKEKINILKGKYIQIRTSQNTSSWSSDTWFSDLSLADTKVLDSGGDVSDETSVQLQEKIIQLNERADKERELRIEASNRAESYQAKYNEVSDKNIALEEKYTALEEEFDELSKIEQKVVVEQGKELDKLNILGKTFDFQFKGHPLKSFALRQGIAHISKGRLQLKIVKKIQRNMYEVELPMYNNQRVPMALGIDNKTFFIKSVEWGSASERSKLKELGYNEIELKSGDYSLEELVNINKEVVSNL